MWMVNVSPKCKSSNVPHHHDKSVRNKKQQADKFGKEHKLEKDKVRMVASERMTRTDNNNKWMSISIYGVNTVKIATKNKK